MIEVCLAKISFWYHSPCKRDRGKTTPHLGARRVKEKNFSTNCLNNPKGGTFLRKVDTIVRLKVSEFDP